LQVEGTTLVIDEQASDERLAALVGLGNALACAIVQNFLAAKELDAAFQAFNAARGVTS